VARGNLSAEIANPALVVRNLFILLPCLTEKLSFFFLLLYNLFRLILPHPSLLQYHIIIFPFYFIIYLFLPCKCKVKLSPNRPWRPIGL
jgi:hypothetical protein